MLLNNLNKYNFVKKSITKNVEVNTSLKIQLLYEYVTL